MNKYDLSNEYREIGLEFKAVMVLPEITVIIVTVDKYGNYIGNAPRQ